MQLDIKVPRLKISADGVFKYILIQAKANGIECGVFVRGDKRYEYHADNYKGFREELKANGFTDVKKSGAYITGILNGEKVEFECLGGGRIEHKKNDKKCSVYGYSKTFGHVDHKIAQKIISEELGYPL